MESKRLVYLKNLSLDEALAKWLEKLSGMDITSPLPPETVKVDDCLGRVTSSPVFAKSSSPHCHCAAMDGFAVRIGDTFGASEAEPRRLATGKEAVTIDTGDPMPDGFCAVIMIEDVEQVSDSEIEITSPATPWQHVRTVGEDIVATELILPENHRIRPVDMAAMLSGGISELPVRKKPVITMIPTGSELVEPGKELKRGNIVESNSRLMAGMVSGWGAEAVRHEIVPDDFNAIKEAVAGAVSGSDIVAINAGSSAGREDYTVHVMEELGEVLVHGVRIKPAKPVVLGIIEDTPVIGVPGYPVSAALATELFIKPVVYALQGLTTPAPPTVRVRISRKITSSLGAEEFVRVKLGKVGRLLVATPVERGAGALMALARADGILRIPENCEGIKPDEEVDIEQLRNLDAIENTIVASGSHDITLDILASELKKCHPELSLSSANVGSMGGLMALKRGEAHMAGAHLLDEESGEYNLSYVKRYLPDLRMVLVNLTFREQGLIVAKGNPKKIRSIKDLTRDDLVFISRQRGAGTRILFDYQLKTNGIDPEEIDGYEREEYTHMAVAAAVLDGVADAGMGIMAAANALDLDFIPVATERYDLVIPDSFIGTPRIEALLGVIKSEGFKERVKALGGYDVSRTGETVNGP